MYENLGIYFIYEKLGIYLMYENTSIYICREELFTLFFNQKNQHFTIIYNDTSSFNLGLVKCEFCRDFQGNGSQTSVCFRITWRVYELKLSDCCSRTSDLVNVQIPVW